MYQSGPIPKGYGIERFPQLLVQEGFAIGGVAFANSCVSRSKKVIRITKCAAICLQVSHNFNKAEFIDFLSLTSRAVHGSAWVSSGLKLTSTRPN